MVKEVRIKLTTEQKAKIKSGTGKVINEIRVGSLGNSLAVTSARVVPARMVPGRLSTTSARMVPGRLSTTSARMARVVAQRATRDNQD